MALGMVRKDILRSPWTLVLLLQASWLVFLWVVRGEVQLKPIRDAIIMPLFILLGMCARHLDIGRFLLRANLAIIVFAVFEVLFLDNFLSACNVIDYFISKGSTPEFQRDFSGTELFVSSIRPNGRFLVDIPGVHRLSSIFLEPVSLGMYGAISGMILLAFQARMSRLHLYLGLLTSCLLIWLADGRLAFGVFLLCLLVKPFISRIPAWFAIFVLPTALIVGWSVTALGLGSTSGEGIAARLHSTFTVFSRLDLSVFVGLGGLQVAGTVDTGLGYLLETQGLFGTLIFWLAPILVHRHVQGPARSLMFFMAIYFGAGFLFSAALYTIKTAALLWFVFGYTVLLNTEEDRASAPQDPYPERPPRPIPAGNVA